eukprot:3298237-Pyramimonas_sp.AAC.1
MEPRLQTRPDLEDDPLTLKGTRRHDMTCCAVLCYAQLRDVMLCVAMLCGAMLHCAMPRHAMACYAL